MGRSKKSGQVTIAIETTKLFCYFCDAEFHDERVLIQHQLSKHFRCPECRSGISGKCNTLHGLMIHYRKVHTAELKVVPNAKEGRDDPFASMQIIGTRNVPEEVLAEWRQKSAAPALCGLAFVETGEILAASQYQMPSVGPTEEASSSTPSTFSFAAGHSTGPGTLAEMLLQALPMASPAVQGVEPPETQDWSHQVHEWMSKKKPEPEQVRPPPPDMDVSSQFGDHKFPVPPQSSMPPLPQSIETTPGQSAERDSAWWCNPATQPPLPVSSRPLPELQAPRSQSRGKRSQSRGGRDYRAREFRRSRSPPASSRPFPEPPAPRSRSRGNRSQSRGRRDYRAREFRRSRSRGKPPLVESRTIQITGRIVSSRIWLKKEMERFGRVEVCHTGNRQNPEGEPPWVRFEKTSSAEVALQAINSGQVLLEGEPLTAEMKRGGRTQQPSGPAMQRSERRDLEITSRDLARDDRRRY